MKKLGLLLLLLSSLIAYGQSFYDLNTVQTIRITFAQSNWDALLDAENAGADGYVMAQSVEVNGVMYDSVGIKYKGNSSYNASQPKNPFHIELDTYKDQNYQGYTDIKLSNVIFDPSFVREALAYKILRNYMHAPLANYTKVYVNGTLIGLYTNVESISKKFVDSRFGSKTNAFFSCSPPAGAGPQTTNLPTLVYLGTDSNSYYSAYEMKSDNGWSDLINLTNTLANNTTNIENVLDVDRALWMLAFDNVMVNLDSYIGQFKQNYYLYKDNNGRFNPIVWDLNMSFGVFGMTGSGGQLNSTTKKNLTHTLHSTESSWPLVQKLLAIPTYKKKYLAHYKTILTEAVSSGSYLTDAQALQALISADVTADNNKFSYQSNITNNLTNDVTAGNNTAPGLSSLMSGRNTYLTALADFTATQPAISAITPSVSSPAVGATISMTATVQNTNTSAVFLNYRAKTLDRFTKVQMYDDGAHSDGAAGDNVYGANMPITNAVTQYYIYAENNTIGVFSPARAEHEFHILNATYATLSPGDLVVNEIMAQNTNTVTDDDGQYEDWFELYNNTNNTISLDNLYATDNPASLQKWQFPTGITIAPHSYQIVWADQDLTQTGVHANFKFSVSGESCILSYANGVIVDSVTFGQQTADMGYARVPNGTGNFVIQAPTFNANNEGATFQKITAGQLVINELMASNLTTASDSSGEYADWLELYNNTSSTLVLDSLYASNDKANPLKWRFPNGTTLAPYSYLIVWADQDLTEAGLHADFEFSASGDACMLSYNDGSIVDSVSFGAQTTDMGFARVPNGTGNFVIQAPTFSGNNEFLNYPKIAAGKLVINEIMASNTATATDPSGEFADWLELYNNSTDTLNLNYLFASDDMSNMQKWQFPTGLKMAPHTYLIVWADQDLTESGIHADFKFSASGESCILSYPDGTVVDSVTFGAQTTDMGYARNPNGTGPFVLQAPTFNANNEGALGLNQVTNFASKLKVYPNPSSANLNILSEDTPIESIEILSLHGQLLFKNTYTNQNSVNIDLSSLANGLYVVSVNNQAKIKVVKN